MEDWQKTHILKNLPDLLDVTIFNCIVIAEMEAENVLSKYDVEKFDAEKNRDGNSHASRICYELLTGRKEAYKVLTRALMKNNQTEAARILIKGVPLHECFSKPLTYLGISTNLDDFWDKPIEVQGQTFKVNEFFPANMNFKSLQEIFQETVNELEIYDTFVSKQRTFVLAVDTIPQKPPFYIDRLLSNRIKLDESIFKAECPDVFVFKNSIKRYKVTEIAKPNSSSSSRHSSKTSRFIHLDTDEDWINLKSKSKVPIHLINFEAERQFFLLEDTSAPSAILGKLGSRKERVYLSENEFTRQQLSPDFSASSVCICDTPGMGKTFLLANIARLMSENLLGRIIVFIPLTTFATDLSQHFPDSIVDSETALLSVLKYASNQNALLLRKLVNAKLLHLELFFDGFDEVPSDKAQFIKQVFLFIKPLFPQVKMYISSRPHMRQELEDTLQLVAYDILPFNREDQVNLLAQVWSNNVPTVDKISLQNYARTFLEAIIKSFTTTEKDIAGIPLLCQLMAVVYSEKVTLHSVQTGRFDDVHWKMSELYKKFTEERIKLVAKTREKFTDIKLDLICQAVDLLFPEKDFHKDRRLKNARSLTASSDILNTGLMVKHPNKAPEFIHRTFAEYLVAEYFSTKLQDGDIDFGANSMFEFILENGKSKVASVTENDYDYHFMHPVVVSFFNSFLDEVEIPENMKIKVATFVALASSEEFISILCTCCQQNVYNIFSLLTEAFTTTDNTIIHENFTTENIFKLISICIRKSTSEMFHCCIELINKVQNNVLNAIDGSKALMLAVEYLNYEAVEYFIDRVPPGGLKLLEKCVKSGYDDDLDIGRKEDILELLLKKHPSLTNETPSISAFGNIHLRLMKVLVGYGVKLTDIMPKKFEENNCVVHAASYMTPNDFHNFLQYYFTQCNADVLLHYNGKWTKTMTEIIQRITILPETLQLLFDVPGSDINMKNKKGNNLAFLAAKGNQLGNLRQLVERGLDYNERGTHQRSLLHAAAYWGDEQMVKYLLSLKLDPNCRTNIQATPLHYAVNNLKGLSIVMTLVENGADVQAKNSDGQTILHSFALYSNPRDSNVKIIEYLVKKGLRVNDKDNDGNTPLHYVTFDKKIKKCLVGLGADISTRNKKGETPEAYFTRSLRENQ